MSQNVLKIMVTNLIIYNWYYITEICQFSNCHIYGGSEVNVGSANGEQECAQMVKITKPDALGATLYSGIRSCWAEYGTKIGKKSITRCCLFSGIPHKMFTYFQRLLSCNILLLTISHLFYRSYISRVLGY